MSTSNYSLVVSTTTDALKASDSADKKLKQAGQVVRDFYVTKEAFRAVKKQFQADAIIPALPKHQQAWLSINVKDTDKDSPEGKLARENSAKARGTVTSYFSKIEAHAFPKEKTEVTPREPSMAFIEDAIKLAKKGQKLENAPFNLLKVMAHMNAMLKEMNVTAETEM
jgi:hypothetical protein